MKRFSTIHIGNIGKAFSLTFFLVSFLWAIISFIVLGDIYVSWFILGLNLLISGILTFLLYRYRYHTILSFDAEGFELLRGKEVIRGKWEEFSKVSLVHKGSGNFEVRLYRSGDEKGDFVDLPVSALRLDPSSTRFEIMKLVKEAKARAKR